MKEQLLKTAIRCVEVGGGVLLEYFGRLHDATQKNENTRDLVTKVDLVIEDRIKNIILEANPSHNVIAEETGNLAVKSPYCWHVDPIDGTVNYSQGIPLCAVSVGLEFEGEIIVGAIGNPFNSEVYYASKGEGAFLNGQKLSVSVKSQVNDGLYIAAFPSASRGINSFQYQTFGFLNDKSRGVLRIGSAALALAYLAAGRVDGVWGRGLHSWDVVAGLILAKEAGGRFTNHEGNSLTNYGDSYVASNGLVHDELLDALFRSKGIN
jgi:myo-inositol-1(or 4)-monophosphatase